MTDRFFAWVGSCVHLPPWLGISSLDALHILGNNLYTVTVPFRSEKEMGEKGRIPFFD